MDRIITISSLTIDLERVRAVKINNYFNVGDTNILTVEYNSRFVYSKNPFTNDIEKDEIQDIITKTYPSFEIATLYQREIEECWKEYLLKK